MNARVISAQAEVASRREALIDTARELQQRLQLKTLVRDAWENAKVKGADMAEEAVDAVKRRPVATGGIIAAVAMFLARAPIKDGVSKLYDAMTSDDAEDPPPPARRVTRPRKTKTTAKTGKSAPRSRRKTETE